MAVSKNLKRAKRRFRRAWSRRPRWAILDPQGKVPRDQVELLTTFTYTTRLDVLTVVSKGWGSDWIRHDVTT